MIQLLSIVFNKIKISSKKIRRRFNEASWNSLHGNFNKLKGCNKCKIQLESAGRWEVQRYIILGGEKVNSFYDAERVNVIGDTFY